MTAGTDATELAPASLGARISEEPPWWETAIEGELRLLGLIKLDRVDSTKDWDELPEETVFKRRTQYAAGVEYVARAFAAAEPLHFQGDGVMLFLPLPGDDAEEAAATVLRAAQALWERVRLELNLPVRVAAHVAEVRWARDTGHLADPAIDRCGHLEHATPTNAIAVTEDVYLALPDRQRAELAPLGVTRRDGLAAYVFPGSAAQARPVEGFEPTDDLAARATLRAYALGPDVRRLRYVGLRLHKAEPPSLDVLDVFVPPKVKVRARELAAALGLPPVEMAALGAAPWTLPGMVPAEGEQRRTLQEVFGECRAMAVLGDPGSGKTTLLRWLAVIAARGPLELRRHLGIVESLLPVPLSVGRLAEVRRAAGASLSVPEAAARYFPERSAGEATTLLPALLRALSAGSCLVLLDGLDEVRPEERASVHAWLESFVASFPRCRYVVSSRQVGYGGFALPGGVEVMLVPFDDAQVERYVRAFYGAYLAWEGGAAPAARAHEQSSDLLEALRRNGRLNGLARNPFLLSALALIHRAEGRLPRHRVQAYEVFARALCETWAAARRLVRPASDAPAIAYEEEALPLLGQLALMMHESYPTGAAPQEVVVGTLADALAATGAATREDAGRAARAFLDRAGKEVQILYERGPGTWSFLHLTFQEFFAAAGLHAAEQFEAKAMEKLFDPRWEEVIRLGVGYLALVQKRPAATRALMAKVLAAEAPEPRRWVTEVLEKQIPMAALLASEAGDALPREMQEEIARRFVEWGLGMQTPAIKDVVDELRLTDLGKRVEACLRAAVAAEDGVRLVQAQQLLGRLEEGPQADDARRLCKAKGAMPVLGSAFPAHGVDPITVSRMLRDPDPARRMEGLWATGLSATGQVADVALLLSDRNLGVRLLAGACLGGTAGGEGVAVLLRAMDDSSTRFAAAFGLGQRREQTAVPKLLAVLASPGLSADDQRRMVIQALWKIAAAPALPEP
jgi:NACHT domain